MRHTGTEILGTALFAVPATRPDHHLREFSRSPPRDFSPCGAVNISVRRGVPRLSSVSGTAQLLHCAVAFQAPPAGICRCRQRRSIRTSRERVPRGIGSLVPMWRTGGEAKPLEIRAT